MKTIINTNPQPDWRGVGEWRCYLLAPLLLIIGISLACERDTKLKVEDGNPPKFAMTGNGTLTAIRVRGPHKQREAKGEALYLYWVIEIDGREDPADVETLSPVIYGKVPDGYKQVYPERGDAPPLVEGEHYYVRVVTSNANGDDGYFMLRNGKVIFAKYEYQLEEK